jgi:hypothetical protein
VLFAGACPLEWFRVVLWVATIGACALYNVYYVLCCYVPWGGTSFPFELGASFVTSTRHLSHGFHISSLYRSCPYQQLNMCTVYTCVPSLYLDFISWSYCYLPFIVRMVFHPVNVGIISLFSLLSELSHFYSLRIHSGLLYHVRILFIF